MYLILDRHMEYLLFTTPYTLTCQPRICRPFHILTFTASAVDHTLLIKSHFEPKPDQTRQGVRQQSPHPGEFGHGGVTILR